MKRVTHKDAYGHYYMTGDGIFLTRSTQDRFMGEDIDAVGHIEDILGDDYGLDRLRELLEACKGLEPSEIAESKLLIATRKDPEKLARMAELVEADREGQCVVLPKDGMVYYIEEAGGEKWVANKPIQQIIVRCGWGLASLEFSLLDAGKYFTREAAEAALKGAQNGR